MVTLTKNVKKLNKIIFSHRIETKFSEQINRIIIEKILKEKSKKNAVKFVRKCKIIQCFNCYKYEHIDKKCKNITKCNHCAERHDTNQCNKNEIKIIHKCVNCELTKHQIWARMCSIRHKKVERIKKGYDISSVLYSTTIKIFIIVTEQSNKMFVSNEFISKNFRVQIQISQQQKLSNKKKPHFIAHFFNVIIFVAIEALNYFTFSRKYYRVFFTFFFKNSFVMILLIFFENFVSIINEKYVFFNRFTLFDYVILMMFRFL